MILAERPRHATDRLEARPLLQDLADFLLEARLGRGGVKGGFREGAAGQPASSPMFKARSSAQRDAPPSRVSKLSFSVGMALPPPTART